MAIKDVLAQNASLANDYGASHGSNSPANHELTLWFGDPLVTDDHGGELADVVIGVEADSVNYPGYAPVTIPNDGTGWPTPPAGGAVSVTVTFPAPTGEWATQIDHWALRDPLTGVVWDTGAIDRALVITGASGSGPVVIATIFHPDALSFDEF